MRTLVLQLFNYKNRPSFQFLSNNTKVMCLLDSGAETPVWCTGEGLFLAAYPNAVKQSYDSEIYGFGKDPERGPVYIIPEFVLRSKDEEYKIINLQIVVCDHPLIGYDFIMSDTMFSKTDTFIHRIGDKYAEIYFEKDCYRCAVKRAGDTFSIVIFSQEEIPE